MRLFTLVEVDVQYCAVSVAVRAVNWVAMTTWVVFLFAAAAAAGSAAADVGVVPMAVYAVTLTVDATNFFSVPTCDLAQVLSSASISRRKWSHHKMCSHS